MLNKVLLIGRVVKDAEVRFFQNGTQVATFSIAVSRKFKGKDGSWQEESYFFDVEAYGALAERVASSLGKGYQILIEGSLRQDRWETNSGEKRSKIKIVADAIKVISKPANSSSNKDEITPQQLFDRIEASIEDDLSSDDDLPF